MPALAATVVLGGGGTALGLAVGGPSGNAVTPQITPFAAPVVLSTAPVVDPTPSVAATRSPAASPSPSSTPRARPDRRRPDTLSLRVTGSECYVQVVTWNDHLLVRRILHHGQHVAYHQSGLQVVLGDAGAVRMSIQGRPAHRAGSAGEVRRFRVG